MGTVLFTSRAPIGYVAIASAPIATNQGFRSVNCSGAVSPEYLRFYLRFAKPIAENLASGTTFAEISGTNVGRIPLPLPPLAEQRRIAERVDALLARVEAARARLARASSLLKRFRQSVLAAACSGCLTEDWRGTDSQDRPWATVPMGSLLAHLTSGSRDWSPYYGRGSGTFIMAQNVRPLAIDLSFRQPVDPPENDSRRPRSRVNCGDLLVTIVGANTGDACRVAMALPEHYVCQSVALLRPRDSEVSQYLNLVLNSPEHGQRQFQEFNYGAGRPHLSFDQLRAVEVPLPPVPKQHEIVGRVEALFALADSVEARIAAAATRAERLTQAILARAFCGELVPTEAEFARQEGRDYEPAAALLVRIQAERAATSPAPRQRRGRGKPTQQSGRASAPQ